MGPPRRRWHTGWHSVFFSGVRELTEMQKTPGVGTGRDS